MRYTTEIEIAGKLIEMTSDNFLDLVDAMDAISNNPRVNIWNGLIHDEKTDRIEQVKV